MSKPPDAKFLGFLDKNASDEELIAWLQQAIAEAEKAEGDSEKPADTPSEVPGAEGPDAPRTHHGEPATAEEEAE